MTGTDEAVHQPSDGGRRNVNGMTVATRNVKDFEQAGVPALNPFEPA
jgi:hypothetical protein